MLHRYDNELILNKFCLVDCFCWLILFLEFHFLQKDIFELVGVPLVENCLAGFNSSVFAYGQVHLKLSLFQLFQYVSVIL